RPEASYSSLTARLRLPSRQPARYPETLRFSTPRKTHPLPSPLFSQGVWPIGLAPDERAFLHSQGLPRVHARQTFRQGRALAGCENRQATFPGAGSKRNQTSAFSVSRPSTNCAHFAFR